MDNIILYLLNIIQEQYQQICWLILFICRYIPLKQWAHDEIHSPKYQKFLTDKLPVIKPFIKQDWILWNEYYRLRYGKAVKPVKTHKGKTRTVPEDIVCPLCGAPHEYIYDNTGGRGQFKCKICGQTFVNGEKVTTPLKLQCPYCGHALQPVKDRKHFRVHKCINDNCSYYKRNLNKLPKDLPKSEYWKYKLRYLYREFSVNFFDMDLNQLPKWATSFKYKKNNAYIMGLCLTYRVNLKLSLRQTVQALKEIHGIEISHTMVNNYAKTAAVIIRPFVDSYDYNPSNELAADETYIKIKGVKSYVWLIMDKISRSILGYQVSTSRDGELLTGNTFGENKHFSKTYIPLNSRSGLENPDCKVNENGIPCCPNDDSLPMKHDGTSTRKNGLKRYKFVCPKIKCVKDASTGKYHRHCICDNPCTTSECGRIIYVYPEKDLRAYPGTIRGTEEWDNTYKIRTAVERDINHIKENLCLAGRRTQNEKTLHADLILAGITQLITVVLADKIKHHEYIRSLKPLIA